MRFFKKPKKKSLISLYDETREKEKQQELWNNPIHFIEVLTGSRKRRGQLGE
jgi:hypothetical protein